MTKDVRVELVARAQRAETAAHNGRVLKESQAEFAGLTLSRADTRRAIDEDRAERERRSDETGPDRGA